MPAGHPLRCLCIPLAALLLLLAPAAAPAAPPPSQGGSSALASPRCPGWLFAAPEEGGGAALPTGEETLPDVLTRDEPEEPPLGEDEDLGEEGARSYQEIQKYASKKLENVRISLSIYNFLWIEMKEGSAGWGHYDDLFRSHAFFQKLTLGKTRILLPTGGFELSYIGMPFYQLFLGCFAELYTGESFLGNKFDDLIISNAYLGIRLNLFNENTAMQKWDEMFRFDRPKHFLGINIYLKAAVLIAFWNRVKVRGAFTTGYFDTYFNQTETLGYFLYAGFEYRFATMGFFLEAGWKYTQHPDIAQPLIKANHFRTFPVQFGLAVYFGG